jgi:hypothetical protein
VNEIAILDGFDEFIEEEERELGLIVKSYSEIASLSASGGKVTFVATEVVVIDERRGVYFINVQIERPNQHPSTAAASIPYDEIDRLAAGAGRLMRAGIRGLSRMKNFEASISTSDQKVRLVVFNALNGRVMCLIEVSGVSIYFGDITKLSDVASGLVKAKEEIDRIKLY